MRYGLPAASIFSTPEREFLRVAAIANPDWNLLRELGARVKDWREVWSDGQLHGVMCWRILDPQMDGIVPEEVREECRGHLEWLEESNRVYHEDCEVFLGRLDSLNIPYVIMGGPPQYAYLGLNTWPRQWDDLDILFPEALRVDLGKIVEECNPVSIERSIPEGGYYATTNKGTRFSIASYMPVDDYPWFGQTWGEELITTRTRVDFLGIPWWYLSPEMDVVSRSCISWWIMCDAGARLPLWSLARIANAAGTEGFAWEKVSATLRHDLEERERLGNLLWEPRLEKSGTITHGGDLSDTNAPAQVSLWTLDLANRVYSFLPTRVEDLISPYIRREPLIITQEAVRKATRTNTDDWRPYLCEWVHWPGDEAFLFDCALIEGMRERVQAGIWRIVKDGGISRESNMLPLPCGQDAKNLRCRQDGRN